jgi:PLP dependent protein
MSEVRRKLSENVRRVRERIAEACIRAHRDPSAVALVAVTKYATIDLVKMMVDLGLPDLGESRVQELTKRAAMVHEFLSRRPRDASAGVVLRPRWHMVGHLQRNKVKALLPWVDLIHSVDSLRLAEEIDAEAAKLGRNVGILMEVNLSGETSKSGVAVAAATHLAEHVATLPHVSLCGLMTMAPLTEDRGVIHHCFVRSQELFEEIAHELPVGPQFRHLSMGMSGDFEIAIAAGATIVRIGSALFEGLPTPGPS